MPARTHRTQRERSDATRELLLDATVDCLVELGYAGTSINEICRRAGVSRGAQQHHFASKAELMAQAVEHLVVKLTEQSGEVRGSAATKVNKTVDELWEKLSGTLFTAALELWVAARTDDELRAAMEPMDRMLGRSTLAGYREITDGVMKPGSVDTVYWMTINLIRGLALDAMIGGDPRRHATLLNEWKRIVKTIYLA
nr:TetR/AcrR family transcriptional regulator [Herbihabitans rhizosphaerae]